MRIGCFLAALVPVALLALGVYLLSEDTTAIHREVARAQAHYQPIIDALAKYHAKHGRYPDELQALIKEGLLNEIPPPLAVENTDPDGPTGQPIYKCKDGGRNYTLQFWYYFYNQGGLGIGDTTYAEWSSWDPVWRMEGPGY